MKEEFRIIIAGSRDFNNYTLLEEELLSFLLPIVDKDIVIISGGARGADRLGEIFADHHNYKKKIFPANWDLYGKKAGYLRNIEMADYALEKNGMLFAFWDGLSKGTKHMIDIAKKRGLETRVVYY